jgi:hypothetical protein
MYVLELPPREKPPRCLTGISHSGIQFNVSGHREFQTLEEIEAFKQQWKKHFFDLNKLTILEVEKKSA